MNQPKVQKYKPYPQMDLPKRRWPSKRIEQAPTWCSVDLRDGNQALVDPMTVEQKLKMFGLLVDLGFKEIEVGFPSASEIEFAFLRRLIDEDRIPDDVSVQILCQARQSLIERSFEAFKGAKKVIFHVYNSTSTLQRKVVFGMDQDEIAQLAVEGVKKIKELNEQQTGTEIVLQYSPESFTGTEMPYALEVCEKVVDAWQPKVGEKVILNLPATVEMSTPNIYADQIEWFCSNIDKRDQVVISLHPHNDRGTAVAATELALLAGADRVEGTLFGNGERTGNVDVVTLAMNMFTQGVDPMLKIDDMNHIIACYEETTKMRVHERHPYAGKLVFTAFSGSHQDAISKGLHYRKEQGNPFWEVPYLPLDPEDIGRRYEKVIRINSQSGKGGVAFVLESEYGYKLPKAMHPEFGSILQGYSEQVKREVQPEEIFECFEAEYLNNLSPFRLKEFSESTFNSGENGGQTLSKVEAKILFENGVHSIKGEGDGPIEAFVKGIRQSGLANFKVKDYDEHALSEGAGSKAVAFIQIAPENQKPLFGVGVDSHIGIASAKAVISALNRSRKLN